jgi:ankyrin repeat protein
MQAVLATRRRAAGAPKDPAAELAAAAGAGKLPALAALLASRRPPPPQTALDGALLAAASAAHKPGLTADSRAALAAAVAMLLAAGASANATDDKGGRGHQRYTALHYAAYAGNAAMVQHLLDTGAEVRLARAGRVGWADGRSCLLCPLTAPAVWTGFWSNLLGNRPPTPQCATPQAEDVDGRGRGARASVGGVAEAAALLPRRGASTGSRDARGATPLHYAKDREVMALLLDAGAEVDARDHEERTPLLWLLRGLMNAMDFHFNNLFSDGLDDIEIFEEVQFLTARGADANACDAEGRTALSYAVRDAPLYTGAVEALVEAGARVGDEAAGAQLILEALGEANDGSVADVAGVISALLDAGAGATLGAARKFAELAARADETEETGAEEALDFARITARLLRAAMRAHEEGEGARVAAKIKAAVEADRREVASGLRALITGAAAEARRLEAARAAATN